MKMEFRLLPILLFASQLCTVAYSWTTSTPIQRIQVQDFNAEEYYKSNDPQPLLIANALSPADCKQCSDALMSIEHQLTVELQNQVHNQGTEVYPGVPLVEAMDAILYESTSASSFLTFCEGLLEVGGDKGPLQGVRQKVMNARDRVFPDDPDWFGNYFPPALKPSEAAVVVAGAGTTSALHRDPFEWMGTSLCVEGSNVWRFIDPKSNLNRIDEVLKTYRLESVARGGGRSMSAGWQSDVSLYRTRQHKALPGNRQWYEMENEEEKRLELQRVGSSLELLTPDELEDSSDLAIATAIQQAGDLLLIPAHWWHQTYTMEPSAVIASQRCGRRDSTLVLQHILNHNQVTSTNVMHILTAANQDPAKALDAVLAIVV
jgi:hypothetical protein